MSWGVSLTSVSTTMVGPFEFLTVFSSEMVPRLVAFLHLRDSFDWFAVGTSGSWRGLLERLCHSGDALGGGGWRGKEGRGRVGKEGRGRGGEGGEGKGGGRRGEGEYEGERRGEWGEEMCINRMFWSVAPLTLGHHDLITITS